MTVSKRQSILLNMLSSQVRQIVTSCAEQYGVKKVWLFGSAIKDEKHAKDFDFAVEGLSSEKFFDFYGRLFFELPKPVDLVDLSQNLPIASLIRQNGICIYERGS